MSSKYQEAFNYLFGAVHINPSKETYNKNVQIIKELVDKETPKEVINTGTAIFCPKCSKMFYFVIGGNGLCVTIPQYCDECGQKLGSDECD